MIKSKLNQTVFDWKNSLNLILVILTPLILFFISVVIYHDDIDRTSRANFSEKWSDVIALISARASIIMDDNYSIDNKFASDLYLLPSFLSELEFIILIDRQNRPVFSVGETSEDNRLLAEIGMKALSGQTNLEFSDNTILEYAVLYAPVIRDREVFAAVIMGIDEEKPLYMTKSTLVSIATKSAIPFALWVAAVILVGYRIRRKTELEKNCRGTEVKLLSMGYSYNDARLLGESSLELIVSALGLKDGFMFIVDEVTGKLIPCGTFNTKLSKEIAFNSEFEPADPRLRALSEKKPEIYGLSGTGRARSIETNDKSVKNRRIAIPLIDGDDVRGLIDIGVKPSVKINDYLIGACEQLAGRLAVAMTGLLEHIDTGNQLAEFQGILETVETVNSSPDLHTALNKVSLEITENKNVRFCRIYTLDEGGLNLVLAAETWSGEGSAAVSRGVAHTLDDMPIHKIAILSGQSQVIKPDEIEKHLGEQKDIFRREMKNCIALIVPLLLGDRQLGCFSVGVNNTDEFPIGLRTRLERLAHFLAASLSRTQLCMRLKRAFDKLSNSQNRTMQSERLAAIASLAGGISDNIGGILSYLREKISGLRNLSTGSLSDSSIEDINIKIDTFAALIERFDLFVKINKTDCFQQVELAQLIGESKKELDDILTGEEWSGENIDLQVTITGSGQIYGDKSNLKTMVRELALNGMEAITGNGKIVIDTRVEMNLAILEIRDNGEGIPDESRNKVFEPFFTTREGSGRGLGLSMVFGIVTAHDGSIEITGTATGGTNVIVRIPLVDPDQTALYNVRKGTSNRIPLSTSQ